MKEKNINKKNKELKKNIITEKTHFMILTKILRKVKSYINRKSKNKKLNLIFILKKNSKKEHLNQIFHFSIN